MVSCSRRVESLSAVGRADLAVAGGKGANLGELIRAGFAVPPGFVVTTALYREALTSIGVSTDAQDHPSTAEPVDPRALRRALDTLTIPPRAVEEIEDAYRELGEGPVAVRSSATAEDLPGAAFAGQQETFLNVVGRAELIRAVRECWASLWADRAVAYRDQLAVVEQPQIAVVVQRMIPSEFAGVLFTANPVTGARDEVVIELSPGLGEAVVSGLVTPERVVTDRSGRIRERHAGRQEVVIRARSGGGVTRCADEDRAPVLPTSVLTALALEGIRIGDHFGRPQDVEWAYADGRMWIVQARPLTALPPAPITTNRLQREMIGMCADLVPIRPYPLDLTAWTVPGWFAILARMAAEVPAIRIDVTQILPEVDGVVTELRPPRARLSWATLTTPWRIRPQLRRFDPARWTADPRYADYQTRVARLRAEDVTALSWSELLTLPAQVLDLLNDFVDLRIDYLPGTAVGVVRLRVVLAVLGLSSAFWPLLSGQPTRTRAANDALHTLAGEIGRHPAWAEAFARLGDDDLIEALDRDGALTPLSLKIQAWVDAFGHRETTSATLISAATWADDPRLLLGHLRGLVARPAPRREDPDRAALAAGQLLHRRRVRLTRTGSRILRAAEAARAAMVFREDSHFHALRVRPVLRSALLEAGDRLARTGALSGRDDVFHLRLEELQTLDDPQRLDAQQRTGMRELVSRRALRRAEYGRAPLVSPATLSPGARRPAPDALVSGAPGGGGRASGPVRIVTAPSEFGRLRPGEVLVCPYTNPAWTPLFAVAAAVVTDAGSVGSHAAIVAREYGIPAVVGTGTGTTVLTDGVNVEVDGDRGHVRAAQPDLRDD